MRRACARRATGGRVGGRLAGVLLGALLLSAGCAGMLGPASVTNFRLRDVASEGDPARRASTRLALEALGHDARAEPHVALGLYERALQVDPTNPWVYLALARHHSEGLEPQRAFAFLDKAEALLAARTHDADASPPGARAHLIGLRGQTLVALGRRAEAARWLTRAGRMDPVAWNDGRLTAAELR